MSPAAQGEEQEEEERGSSERLQRSPARTGAGKQPDITRRMPPEQDPWQEPRSSITSGYPWWGWFWDPGNFSSPSAIASLGLEVLCPGKDASLENRVLIARLESWHSAFAILNPSYHQADKEGGDSIIRTDPVGAATTLRTRGSPESGNRDHPVTVGCRAQLSEYLGQPTKQRALPRRAPAECKESIGQAGKGTAWPAQSPRNEQAMEKLQKS